MTARPGLAVAVGDWSARHRKAAVLGWLLFVVLATVIGSMAGTHKTTDADNGVGESGRAVRMLDQAGLTPPAAETVLVQSGAFTADDPRFRSAVADTVAAVQGTGRVSDVRSPYDSGAFSADRHSALVEFAVQGAAKDAADKVQPVLDAVARTQAAHRDLSIAEFGDASAAKHFNDTFANDFAAAEWTALPLALGILLVVFGALVAAVLPVVLAMTAYLAAFGLLALTTPLVHTSDDASSVMLLVGLAVGVDYCLFYLRREREERAAGRDPQSALRIAAATSGHSVLVSGVTVVVAMAGMFLTGIADFTAMGLATIVVVVVAVLGSVTVLPAMLSMLGDRVEAARIPFIGRLRRSAPEGGSRLWGAVLGRVQQRPLAWTAVATIALLALSAPVLGLHTAQLSPAQELPRGDSVVQVGQRIAQAFPGSPIPSQIVVKAADVDGPAVRQAIAEFEQQAPASGSVFGPITVDSHPEHQLAVISVQLPGSGNDATSVSALTRLRTTVLPHTLGAVPGAEVAVGGSTAASVDFNAQLTDSAAPVFGFVLALAFVLMLASFRSLVVALVTTVLNLLSVGAAYGALSIVFQHGIGASLLGARSTGAITSWLPLFLFVILFGLSMDYHVFVVSRIKEGHDRGLDTRTAVAQGVRGTAGVVTSAAVIMIGVFAIFGTLTVTSMKQVGVGLAVAVLIDATVIRAVLLPAVLTLLGERTWYLPGWLHRLPDLSHGSADPVAPVAAPAGSVEVPSGA
ncbi:MMPL family transporter [Kitasatospora viridis]|uniref:RND superfamily putative drug exporter n=1 Tax=Kitasatospora viridis TaxID=281105 RepID=A0A561UJT1_9ACTN|nr:MMPL family transporter [Kitasatospora viridis]TWF99624.1 RND superfamily putative drug exporter [Kitasatospora viridis]